MVDGIFIQLKTKLTSISAGLKWILVLLKSMLISSDLSTDQPVSESNTLTNRYNTSDCQRIIS